MGYSLLLAEIHESGVIPHQHKKQHPLIKLQVFNQSSFFNCTLCFTPVGCASLLRCTLGEIPFQAGKTLLSQAVWGQTCEEAEAQAGSYTTCKPPPPPSLWDKRDWGRNQALWTLLPAVAVSCIELPEYAIKMQCKPICIISESGLWHSAHQLRLFSTSQSCVCHTHHKHLQCRQSAQTLELCMQLKGSFKTTKITPLLFWRNQVTFFVLNSHQ